MTNRQAPAQGTEGQAQPVESANTKALTSGILSLIFGTLTVVTFTATAYMCGLWAMYLMFLLPGLVGFTLGSIFFIATVTSASVAVAQGRRRLGFIGFVLLVVAFGGVYPGCRKGLHDQRCSDHCADFW